MKFSVLHRLSLASGYKGKLVGNSPELCRALDAHGFADLDRTCALNCALATALGPYDPIWAKWNMGTKEGVFQCLRNTWVDCAPTSERIMEDIDHLPEVLRKIIAASGCVVPDEFLRRGRRAVRADGKGECKGKVRKRQRVETQEAAPHHPELDGAYKLLMNPESFKKLKFGRQSVSAGAL